MTTIILDAKHVGKSVETTEKLTILQDISFQLHEGDSLAIIGSSGSGKSTLLGLLAGLDVPTEGEILLAEKPLSKLSEDERAALRALHVGFVFQSFQLLESLTAVENVMLPLELEGKKGARERSIELLTRVGLGERTHHYPKQLSGGEQQRVAIARAFASNPTILFADEPTGNLDTKTGESIIDLLFQLNEESKTTLVLVTHEARLAERCQYRIQIEGGRLVDQDFNHE
ncbi:ABC transporter ATP-binding protein [Ignatzschineria rhizosphaerae]|uniref:ABC transporter ATP-binding protein n=1 Tax=Ignatzschineria rhizosphaerae TaxID=2923279 RepID=A0ABY3X2Y2_9GAMM|nr:ABC transporter ATP-binding protein [Ignatzschineria rhizosphaerae]UNM97238.1 ABC transporter ATP-binding protein [Ignatzschineria rhizosphaerae]